MIAFLTLLLTLSFTIRGSVAGTTHESPLTRRSMMADIQGQPSLPSLPDASSAASSQGLNLSNIQGDILIGMKKKKERFIFFTISNPSAFKQHLANSIYPMITSTTQILSPSFQAPAAVNIAFSQKGLHVLGVNDNLGDSAFTAGQMADASFLGDPPSRSHWVSAFSGSSGIDGVFMISSDSTSNLQSQTTLITNKIMSDSMHIAYTLDGSVRPNSQAGHEHFGYMDGISQPAVNGFTVAPNPGQQSVDPGVFLLGQTGDAGLSARPSWAKEGSFMAFRQLQQLVPEFNSYLLNNAPSVPGSSRQQRADLLGARMFGRWKSGAPVALAPTKDDPSLAADPQRNNNFDFSDDKNGTDCPFAAHIRKTKPRGDFKTPNTANHIIRAGIPYGPELNFVENLLGKTLADRGLAFVCYQSNITAGFRTLQHTWANNPNFIFGKSEPPGFDPIIGANAGQARLASGLDPTNAARNTSLPQDFVVSRGGEYFFVPSLAAILNPLSR